MDEFLHKRLHELANEERDDDEVRARRQQTVTEIYLYLEDKVIIPIKEYERLKKMII